MSRILTISDELFSRLEAEARARGLDSVEHLLEEVGRNNDAAAARVDAVRRIDGLRAQLFTKYGEMPGSTKFVREDRAR